MATQPNPSGSRTGDEQGPEKRLSYDEGWDLIESLFGSAGEMYASAGGAAAFMRAERASWDEDDVT